MAFQKNSYFKKNQNFKKLKFSKKIKFLKKNQKIQKIQIFKKKYFQKLMHSKLPWSNAFWLGLTPFGPPVWQAQADTELTSTSPTAAVDQKALHLAKRRYSTVFKNQHPSWI